MHKGRTYPFHPKFWITTAFFWPGYMPWKIALEYGFSSKLSFQFWANAPYPIISEPGTIESASQRSYEIPVTWSDESDFILLQINDEVVDGDITARFQMTSFLGGVPTDLGYTNFVSPQYETSDLREYYYIDDGDGGSIPTSFIILRSAVYAEGGSPWP